MMMLEGRPTAQAAGHRQRLRERFLAADPHACSDEALLELLLTYAIPQRDVQPLARRLLEAFGSLAGVLDASHDALVGVDGVGAHAATLLKLVNWIRTRHSPSADDHTEQASISDSQLSFFDLPEMEPLDVYEPKRRARSSAAQRARSSAVQAAPKLVVPPDFIPVVMPLDVPDSALEYGFSNGPTSPHSSRTMMLAELHALLAACPTTASQHAYRAAVVEDNMLLKPTATTRSRSFVRLRELYALDQHVLLFRALRDLWDDDADAQPLIAVLCASARDVVLRATAETLLAVPAGASVTWQMLELVISQHFPDRYNHTTRTAMAQHTLSSWRQAGHLGGEDKKVRVHPTCRPAAVAYALLLGHLCGVRGEALFHTMWSRILDAPAHVLYEQALVASQRGWLEYRRAGSVVEISFRHLLRTGGEDVSL